MPDPREPIDSDVDPSMAGPPGRWRDEATIVATISAGGAIGAGARYLIGEVWPTPPGGFPVSTLTINILGCALIGVLMVLVAHVWSAHHLARPFLGTGILGGFTTFSTYTVDIQRLVAGAHLGLAMAYLVLTLVGALVAVWVAVSATRRLVHWRSP